MNDQTRNHWMIVALSNLTTSFLSPACSGCFLSGRRNAGWRLWGVGWRHACHHLSEQLLLHVAVHPVAIPVCAASWAQGHLRRPPHLLPVCDLWPALHLSPVDNRAECECSTSAFPSCNSVKSECPVPYSWIIMTFKWPYYQSIRQDLLSD